MTKEIITRTIKIKIKHLLKNKNKRNFILNFKRRNTWYKIAYIKLEQKINAIIIL